MTCASVTRPSRGISPEGRGELLEVMTELPLAEVEELAAGLHAAHALEQELEVRVALDEVEVFRVDDEQRRRREMVEKARVPLCQQSQVFLADAPFEAGAAAPHPLDEHPGLRLEVDHQVRRGGAWPQGSIDFFVESELVARQRKAREQRILVEQEIGDRGFCEHVGLRERLEHARALEQEEQLRRQRE